MKNNSFGNPVIFLFFYFLATSKGTGLASPNFKSTWKSMHRSKKKQKGKTGGF